MNQASNIMSQPAQASNSTQKHHFKHVAGLVTVGIKGEGIAAYTCSVIYHSEKSIVTASDLNKAKQSLFVAAHQKIGEREFELLDCEITSISDLGHMTPETFAAKTEAVEA